MGENVLKIMRYMSITLFSELFNWSVQYLNETKISFGKTYPMMRIGEFLTRNKTVVVIENNKTYKRLKIRVRNGGVFLRDEIRGENIGTKRQFLIAKGQFLLSKIDARNGAFGVVPPKLDGSIITGNFWTFDVDCSVINPYYLVLLTTTQAFVRFCEQASNGTTNRHYLQESLFLNIKVPVPSIDEQNKLVKEFNDAMSLIKKEETKVLDINVKVTVGIRDTLGGLQHFGHIKKEVVCFRNYSTIDSWSVSQIMHMNDSPFSKSIFFCKKLSELALINPKTDLSMLGDTDELSFIPMEDISDYYGEWHGNRVGKKSEIKGYTRFQNGDIVWARITPCMQNGKSALLRGLINEKGYGSTEFHVVRLKSEEVLPQYIHALLRHPDVLFDAKEHFTGSAGQQRVPKGYLENLLIPVPPP